MHDGEIMGVGQPLPDLGPQGIEIPAQVTAAPDQTVLEAVRRDQLEATVVDHAEHDPARGGTEIDRRDCERAAGAGAGAGAVVRSWAGGRDGAAHRRNAAATPASTGTCRPVVCERSPEVRANTAFATFSGSTSCPSSVRWA